MSIDPKRLEGLLVDPKEDLKLEVKNWLDLRGSEEDKATLAKAMLAISNTGGGYVVLGFTDSGGVCIEAAGRPLTLDGYVHDLVNSIVRGYCDPQFHCSVHFVKNPAGRIFPIIVVPGGHRVPIRARRAGPHGKIVTDNAIYIRKPGPRSEVPQSAQEWDSLLARCLMNRRDEMFDQIRMLLAGAADKSSSPSELPSEFAKLKEWIERGMDRWRSLVADCPKESGPRLRYGRYYVAYEIEGERRKVALNEMPKVLRASVVRHTGWPPFWYPTREGIAPYPFEDAVECWLCGDPETPAINRAAAYSDFWRVHPDGLAFLIRGYQEDGGDDLRTGRAIGAPGALFDVSLPVWRIGECVLHAHRLARNLFEGPTIIRFSATFEGLANRTLTSIDRRWSVPDNPVSRQDSITLDARIDAETIESNLPEIIQPFLAPLYNLFGFFSVSMTSVVDELARMRGKRY